MNNEILRFENGIKEDGFNGGQNANTVNKAETKNESIIDKIVFDEKVAQSESAISIPNKMQDSNSAVG